MRIEPFRASRTHYPLRQRRAKLVIEPGMTAKNYWRDLWHYRELIYFLAWRDTVVRYKQTASASPGR